MSTLFQADDLRLDQRPDGSVLLRIDVPGRALNLITRTLLQHFDEALSILRTAEGFRVVVIRGDKLSGFIAGADIHELATIQTPEDAYELSEFGQQVFARLEALPFPTIALIHGPCLGGGLELALACDYRLALDHAKTSFGLPEVSLGLTPDWGGTQRLPRVVGLEPALRMILGNQRWNAQQARRMGLVEGCATTEGSLAALLSMWMEIAKRDGKRARLRLPLRTWRQRLLESNALGRGLVFRGTERILKRRVPDDMSAPWEALESVRTGLVQGREAGFERERQCARTLVETPACRNLVQLFLRREAARKLAGEDDRISSPIQTVAIYGLDTAGAKIVQVCLVAGMQVIALSENEDELRDGGKWIDSFMQIAVKEGRLSPQAAQQRLSKLVRSTQLSRAADAQFILVSGLFEEAKLSDVLKQLENHAQNQPILALTAPLGLIQTLQGGLRYPGRVGGLNLLHATHLSGLVEVAGTKQTTAETFFQLKRFVVALGKTPIQIRDSAGGLVSRLAAVFHAEFLLLGSEGRKVKPLVKALKRFGMPDDPRDNLEHFGKNQLKQTAESLHKMAPERYGPCRLLCDQSAWNGPDGKAPPEPLPGMPEAVLQAEARERAILILVNEAARCVEEGIVDRAEDVDLAATLAHLWPAHRGGPICYASDRGVEDVIQFLKQLEGRYGPRFAPSSLLT